MYKVAQKEKLADLTLPGNYQSFNTSECLQYGEGQINLGVDLGQVKLNAVGNVRRKLDEKTTTLNIMLAVDFYLAETPAPIMAHDFDSLPGKGTVNVASIRYKKNMAELLDTASFNAFTTEMGLFGTVQQLPAALNKSLVFTDVKLEWNDDRNAYQSTGPIGLGIAGGKQINKMFEGFIEIQHKRSGDIMDIYIKIDDRNYYYFGYTRGVMQVYSSNLQFLDAVKNLKNKERKVKSKTQRYILQPAAGNRPKTKQLFGQVQKYIRWRGKY
ncbi:MAG: hypothetical protein HC896_16680 [Bacteroidales bacterium]|nr:hypothetical protein [Bacteroidales bacterium]